MKNLVLILSLFILWSCSDDDQNSNNSSFTPTTIAFQEIGQNVLNGGEGIAQSNLVIKNDVEWQQLMTQMNSVSNKTDAFTETNIDFNRFMILAVFLETKPSGWEVEVVEIIENSNAINVTVEDTEYATTVVTQPFHIVKIPLSTKSVAFN